MKKPAAFLLFSIILFLLAPVPSLGIVVDVSGGYVNEPVTVTLDRDSYVIFRMNNGTPVFTYGKEVRFIPHITGNLNIEVRTDEGIVKRSIQITERETEETGGERFSVYYSGTVYLPEGSFTVIASSGKTYTVEWRTAMGALKAASQQSGFSFTVKETDWGPFVSCIASKCEKSDGEMSGWMYQVNGNTPMVGAHEYIVNEGDEVVWYFSRSMDETPETSPMILRVYVKFAEKQIPAGGAMGAEDNQTDLTGEISKHIFVKNVSAEIGEEVVVYFPENISAMFSLISLKARAENDTLQIEVGEEDEIGAIYGKILSTFNLEVRGAEYFEIVFRTDKSVNRDSVVLMKFTGKWVELPTEYLWEDRGYYHFSAEVSSSSTFAIVSKWSDFPLNVTDEPIIKALQWLKTIQNDDGGFANPGEESSISKTSWAIMALAASKQDPHRWIRNGNSPVDYLRNNLNSSLGKMGTADIARTILAITAADENPRNFSGIDLVSMLKGKVKEDGQIGDFIYTTIWGIMALKASGENVTKSAEWLKAQQNEDGGFAWAAGEKSDYDDTAAAIQALIYAGESKDSEVIQRALDYLKTGQNEDGGFRYFGNSSSNAASDAWAIQALVAAGENPREWKKNNISVVDHLLSLQAEEGYFRYTSVQTSNPGYMTVSAIMALLGKPNPVKPEYIYGEVNLTDLTEKPAPSKTQLPTPTPELTKTPKAVVTEEARTDEKPETRAPSEKPSGIPGFEILGAMLALILAFRWRR